MFRNFTPRSLSSCKISRKWDESLPLKPVRYDPHCFLLLNTLKFAIQTESMTGSPAKKNINNGKKRVSGTVVKEKGKGKWSFTILVSCIHAKCSVSLIQQPHDRKRHHLCSVWQTNLLLHFFLRKRYLRVCQIREMRITVGSSVHEGSNSKYWEVY